MGCSAEAGSYGFFTMEGEAVQFAGVWFADRLLGVSEGAKDDPVLGAPVFVVELDEAAVSVYEVVGSSPTYREWCIPAAVVNHCSRRVIYDPLDDADSDTWWEWM